MSVLHVRRNRTDGALRPIHGGSGNGVVVGMGEFAFLWLSLNRQRVLTPVPLRCVIRKRRFSNTESGLILFVMAAECNIHSGMAKRTKRMVCAGCAVFLSAFLLFQLELMASRALLPSYGGACIVWGSAMVFFQIVLLMGYAWSFAARLRFSAGPYALVHVIAAAAVALAMPLNLSAPARSGSGIFPILAWLAKTAGLPALVLSSTTVVVQWWRMASDEENSGRVYTLYAASNAGSLAGLLTYPLVVEPAMDAAVQDRIWHCAYAVLPLLLWLSRPDAGTPRRSVESAEAPAFRGAAKRFWLSASGGAMLLAATNMITLDIASVPLLWAVPLAIYLLTYALAFGARKGPPWYAAVLFPWACVLGWLLCLMSLMRLSPPVLAAVAMHCLVLFVVCRFCHGLLAGLEPSNSASMPAFYVTIAAGGVFGSVIVAWVIPATVPWLAEYPLAIFLAAAAVWGAEGKKEPGGETRRERVAPAMAIGTLAAVALSLTAVPALLNGAGLSGGIGGRTVFIAAAVSLSFALLAASRHRAVFAAAMLIAMFASFFTSEIAAGARVVHRARSYYGTFVVFDHGSLRYLQHGATQHGRQYISGGNKETPLSYFHPSAPVADVMMPESPNRAAEGRKIAMIGLGTGALAAYLKAGDQMTIVELDPVNIPIAEKYFSYLATARARGAAIRLITGDGRMSLRSEPDGSYDVLIVDAFSSGAVPAHLLTVEALREYARVLSPGGIALLHVSNRYLDLPKLALRCVRAAGYHGCAKDNADNFHPDADVSYWVAFSPDREVVRRLVCRFGWVEAGPGMKLPRQWTDGRYSIFEMLWWGPPAGVCRSE